MKSSLEKNDLLKILQICNKAPFPANDGSSIAIYNMARGLIENDAELHLLTLNTKKHFKPDEEVPEEFRKKSHYTSVYHNTNPHPFGALMNLFSGDSYFISRFYLRSFEGRLIALLKSVRFDIVQIEGLFMCVYIDAIRRHSGAKIVLRAHNIEHLIWERHLRHLPASVKKIYLRLQNKRLKRFEKEVLSRIDAVIPITIADEKEFRHLGNVKPQYVCITGVDVEGYQIKLNVPEKTRTVFYFGSMDWVPNQEAAKWFLNNCWRKVLEKVPDAKFIIAGRGMPLDFFHITEPSVQIVENVEDSKLFYQQHQLMVVPLISGSGLRIKIIEGMAYGKAIVSTSVGAEGIRCSHAENIFIADSPEQFSEAVIRLLTNNELRRSIEQSAAQLARKEFNNFNVVSGLYSFYKQLSHV